MKVEQVNEGLFNIVLNDEAAGEIENNQGVITDEVTGETEVLPAQMETKMGKRQKLNTWFLKREILSVTLLPQNLKYKL